MLTTRLGPAALLAAAVWTGAAPGGPSRLAAQELPDGALRVPLVRQATTWSCGAAALQAVLFYWGVFDGKESDLYARLETTPKDGTEPPKLVAGARSFGLEAEAREGLSLADLRAALAKGRTVILDLQAWRDEASTKPWSQEWEDGHYVVLVGMDAERAFVMDPSSAAAYAWLPLAELEERWHDYEDRHGKVRRYQRLGIVIGGKAPPPRPGLVRML